MTGSPVLELDDIVKDYRSLRPVRVSRLRVLEGERVSLIGFDAAAAEVLIGLITGAHLPDRGTVRLFGEPTHAIADGAAWMQWLDRVGIVSDRAVLLEAMTIAQNMAMAFSLEIDPVPPDTRAAVEALAVRVGLDPAGLDVRVADAGEFARVRVNLARALALDPSALLLEHATARLSSSGAARFAADLVRAAASRSTTIVAITADPAFGRALGGRVLHLEPSSGALRESGRGWFRRRS